MTGFKLRRLAMLIEPEPGNPQEIEGVLNPAAARAPDGELYLFPRLVARGNYSRIGIARVRFNEARPVEPYLNSVEAMEARSYWQNGEWRRALYPALRNHKHRINRAAVAFLYHRRVGAVHSLAI